MIIRWPVQEHVAGLLEGGCQRIRGVAATKHGKSSANVLEVAV